ncbi:hypothetical protein N7462_004622 [Penicillium macrosclerotiorum]|uniref:uncharacterized protein n=1 Tax=Penicillium macrosclerotiorum TaxID=303699 RepID=UPI0025490F1A|nr:uncharacterized protein N7462_004622 [Penicillium macrosclerotiorum]KAJ5690230.1 hypothetical protein N7462_004622 [Penicillium macrosclerotiorum]
MSTENISDIETSKKVDHLCVLVHGLWGKPSHLDFIAEVLREQYGEDRLYTLCAAENSGNFTYDGIEVGGERVVREVEDTLEKLEAQGQKITKISVVGYSLGGLIARYAIGLLQAHGWLDRVEPMNFTTFASPHVGVRTPAKGMGTNIWNGLGPRMVSMSGQQMFMVDTFRDTGRPLLSLLADPESIFIQGLKRFKNRSVYGNIVNDRITVPYTTLFSKVDPFRDLEKININYVEGYEQTIVNPDEWLLPLEPKESESCGEEKLNRLKNFRQNLPFYLAILLLAPPATTIFTIYSIIQTCRSQKRIRLHLEGKNGLLFQKYRVPLLVQDMQHVVDEIVENTNALQEPAYLSSSDTQESDSSDSRTSKVLKAVKWRRRSSASSQPLSIGKTASEFPKLALTPEQIAIIDSLDAVGFRKYPVHIHNDRHSHAVIIRRDKKTENDEGIHVMRHWINNGFAI